MFTGIIECLGKVVEIKEHEANLTFRLSSPITKELKVDQSLAHDGVCLTVERINNDQYEVTAIKETLDKSALRNWREGRLVNLERCLRLGDRLDGHIVQGHVDGTGVIESIVEQDGSYLISIKHEGLGDNMTIEKGSITVNGVSLTAFNSSYIGFSVAIIPYTWTHTNMNLIRVDDIINLEFDILGKYASRMLERYK